LCVICVLAVFASGVWGAGRPEVSGDKFIHHYQPHIRDHRPGDPTWKDGKGKGMIGALNYLASKGMNSVYFIPYNIDGGDGKDVWPWTSPKQRYRFDCSKLDLGKETGPFAVQWFNPRTGGRVQRGSVGTVKGPGPVSIGAPPVDKDEDWVALVRSAMKKL